MTDYFVGVRVHDSDGDILHPWFKCLCVALKPLTLLQQMHVGIDILSDLKSTVLLSTAQTKVTLEAGGLLRTEFRIMASPKI